MRLKYALPLLSSAAAFMVVGLSLASAQPPRVQVRPPGSPPQPAEPTTPSGTDQFQTGIEYEPIPPSTRVTFNLEDADLPDLVRLISSITGKRFILPGKTRSIKATVYAPTKVTVREAYNAFLSILEVNGMTVVPAGRYLKIQESANIENQPVSLYTGGSATPTDDRYVTRLHRMTNISADDASQLLGRFKSPAGSVTAYAPTNTLILTDTGRQIRRMLRILESIDVPRTGEQVWIEPIHYADASEIAEKLKEIFPDTGGGGGSDGGAAAAPARRAATRAAARANSAQAAAGSTPATVGSAAPARITSIIPEERTNSLIILATERAYLRILEMIRYLDVPLEGEGRIHVHYVQNGDAEDIANTLSSLIGGGSGGGATAGAGGAARRSPSGAASPAAAAAAGDLFEGEIRVTTHEPTNALVITSSLHDYAALRRVIDKLDRPRRQVFIEAVVMELQVDRSSSLGLSFHGGLPDTGAEGALTLFGSGASNSLGFPASAELTGLAVGVRGPEIEGSTQSIGVSVPAFGVVLNALATSGDANVLSTPHLIAMDNVQAEINVGQNVPLQTSGLAPGALGGLGGLAGLAGQGQAGGLGALGGLAGGLGGGFGVPRQDVGTIIRITPHINEHDEVRLEIEEEISEVGAAQGDLGVVPINRRTAKTEVMVRDQQTVVIGGLMRESVSRSETKIPILGDIPLLGALFRRQSTTRQKNNLLLFLTPYIIRDMRDLRAIYERKMRERQEFLDRYFVFGDHGYEPPVDYSRTRGLLLEMFNEMAELEAEAALAEALRSQPPPEHVPRPAVGTIEREPGEPGEEGDMIIGPDDDEDSLPVTGPDVSALPDSVDVPSEEPE